MVNFVVKFVDIVVISVNTDPSPFVNFVSLSLWGPFCVSTYFRSYVCIVKSFFGLFIKENITFLLLSRNFNFNRRQDSTQRCVLPLSFPADLLLPYIAIHGFKIFLPMKPSCTSNEMISFVAHFDVSKLCEIKKIRYFFFIFNCVLFH